ncbi:MAG: ABC transporter ATP-binding protein [Actinomycetota bacterium]|nr:ABC transporter ATP-binding protein [Actinomycetota bacterium]
MITIKTLTKRYGDAVVVDDFAMEVATGESIALWGPNGAGKTTVIRCLLGLVSYDGEITVAGLDARKRGKAVRSLIGYVPQELSFYDEMVVQDLLDYSAGLRGIGTDRVDEVVDQIGLGDHQKKLVRELSGGLKQRLGLATALLADPPILLLDEPTSNLDASARDAAIRLLENLRHEGRTLVVTSHHIEEVGMLVDRVIAMDSGRTVTECAPYDLAEELGIRAWLHLITDADAATRAAAVLNSAGFNARQNSKGVLVEVSAQQKGKAVAALHSAGIEIEDLEVWR